MIRVLFVCTGNICRSPTAEGVFRQLVADRGLADDFHIESAGIIAYHVGEKPDPRSRQTAQARGVSLDGIRARQLEEDDFKQFDYLLAMDRGHHRDMLNMADDITQNRVSMFTACLDGDRPRNVPDPYYGGADGFETTFDLIYAGCEALLDHILANRA